MSYPEHFKKVNLQFTFTDDQLKEILFEKIDIKLIHKIQKMIELNSHKLAIETLNQLNGTPVFPARVEFEPIRDRMTNMVHQVPKFHPSEEIITCPITGIQHVVRKDPITGFNVMCQP